MSLILVVDDAAAVREPIAAALQLAGYRTLGAADGREALKLAWLHRPSLILLDLAMPVVDGMTCLGALRAAESTAHIPVIVLSAADDRKSLARAARLGVSDYLVKSAFSLPDLLARVKQLIGDGPGASGAGVNTPAA